MAKLQNNFTTPEQSKRLLELGLPANSADCYYSFNNFKHIRSCYDMDNDLFERHPDIYPCWSVGRLIEIYLKCYDGLIDTSFNFEPTDSDNIVELVIEKMANKIYKMKFSKLEE